MTFNGGRSRQTCTPVLGTNFDYTPNAFIPTTFQIPLMCTGQRPWSKSVTIGSEPVASSASNQGSSIYPLYFGTTWTPAAPVPPTTGSCPAFNGIVSATWSFSE